MAKNRRKKRRKNRSKQAAVPRPQLPRPSGALGREVESRPNATIASPEAVSTGGDARPGGPHSEGTVVGTVVEVGREFIWIDIGGSRGKIYASELMLGIGERPADRYAVGDRFEAFVFQVNPDPESGAAQFSIRRASPYPEALAGLEVGSEVQATVVNTYDLGIELDIGGVRGNIFDTGLLLSVGETTHERYQPGSQIIARIHAINMQDRELVVSARQYAPGYVEALKRRTVGDVVSGTIMSFGSDGSLWLDINGLVASVGPRDLDLADGETARDRYSVGDHIDGLFVWQINHEARDLALSVKRNAPGYMEALQRRAVGEVVSATVTSFQSNGGLWLDVDGLVGAVGPQELDLGDGESAQDRYAVGGTIDGLFVWQIDHEERDLALSAKRNTPGYAKVLDAVDRGDEIDCIVAEANEWGVWLGAAGVVGWIPASELALDDGESPQQRYSMGDEIKARVWQIDQDARDIILSVRRLAADFREGPVARGVTIDAVVRGTTLQDVRMPIRVLTVYSDNAVEIPPHALSLSTGMPPRFRHDQVIRVVVTELDAEGRPTRLSHRQTLDGWEAEMRRLSHNTLVPNARPVPPAALSEAELRAGAAAVDLGPITGFVPEEELDRETGRNIATHNETYRVVVESVDYERCIATVSHDRFEQRWQELAAGFEVSAEVDGELRDADGGIALLDLGSGLLAQMPARELPDSDPPGKAAPDRIGESVPLRITAIDRDTQTIHVEPRDQWIESLIGATESETLEFKEVLRGSGSKNGRRDMTHEAMRTITGFLNTSGGNLMIGVNDDLEAVGLESDDGLVGETVAKKIDSAIQTLEDNTKNVQPLNVTDDLHGLVTWTTPLVRGRTLLVVTCRRGPDGGVWLVGKGQPQFWIRRGQETVQLHGREAIRAHLRDRGQRSTASGEANSDE